MMFNLAYICFLIFGFVNFFSPTLKSVAIVAGICFWIAGLIQNQQKPCKAETKILNILALILLFLNLITQFPTNKFFNLVINNLFGEYALWLCASSLICHLASSKQFKTQRIKIGKISLQAGYKEYFSSLVVLGSLITCAYIFCQFLGIIAKHSGAIVGILDQPFTSSGLILIAIFLTLDLKDSFIEQNLDKNFAKIFYLLVLVECCTIAALGQVSVWAGLILGLGYYFIAKKSINPKKIFWSFLIISITIFALQLASPRIERKLKWFTSYEKLTTNKSISCRLEIWQQNLQALKAKPILGLGKVISYNCETKGEVNKLTHMHNIFLQKLVEGGILKFVIWLCFYVMIFATLLKNHKQNTLAMLCILIALSIEGLLENWWGDSEVLQLMLITLAMYTQRERSSSSSGSSRP